MPADLIVVVRPLQLSVTDGFVFNLGENTQASERTRTALIAFSSFLRERRITLEPLFGISENVLRYELEANRQLLRERGINEPQLPDLSVYYLAKGLEEAHNPRAIAQDFNNHPEIVSKTYFRSPNLLPEYPNLRTHLAADPPLAQIAFPQEYLDPSPCGIDAGAAWRRGGYGTGITIVDIEASWQFTHESLRQSDGGVVSNSMSNLERDRSHGTAVAGLLCARRNRPTIRGICPAARIRGMSIYHGPGNAQVHKAIHEGIRLLELSDIILLEQQFGGPRKRGNDQEDQYGYIPIEWDDDVFDDIKTATEMGLIVVEAAGNGSQNLDDTVYLRRFDRTYRDSGAIIVGAGAPPFGRNGRAHGRDRSRMWYSNFGGIVDVQGWGQEVTSSGYGTRQGGRDEDRWYCDDFGGTSAAAAMIAGILACVQGILKSQGRTPLNSRRARGLLRNTGKAQQGNVMERIGNRPDLSEIFGTLGI